MAKTKHQSGTVELVWRSAIKEHPLNPRTMTDAARKKLRVSVQEIGVLDTPVVNKTTGRLVGGHQRLHTIDYLERFKLVGGEAKNDYQIEVAIVEMSEEQEAKALVRLNNQNLQGDWNTDILQELSALVSYDDMMFDKVDLAFMYDDVALPEFDGGATATETKDALTDIKADRKAMQQKQTKENNGDYYVTVVCKDADEKHRLMKLLKLPKGESFIAPGELFAALENKPHEA